MKGWGGLPAVSFFVVSRKVGLSTGEGDLYAEKYGISPHDLFNIQLYMKVPFSYAYTFTIFYYFQYIDYYPLNKYSICDDS